MLSFGWFDPCYCSVMNGVRVSLLVVKIRSPGHASGLVVLGTYMKVISMVMTLTVLVRLIPCTDILPIEYAFVIAAVYLFLIVCERVAVDG